MRKKQTAPRVLLRGFGIGLLILIVDAVSYALFEHAPAGDDAMLLGIVISILLAFDEIEAG